MKYYISFIAIVLVLYGATCQRYYGMSDENKELINKNLKDKRFFLKYSFYYGDFYGNSNICLLSTKKFEETVYLVGIDGKPILPGIEKGVIPFNTEVMIEKVEFPPANRPILTPRFYPWVYLRVDKLSGYNNCIVVIRPDVNNVEDFNTLFGEIFSESNMESYIKGLSAEVREAIYEKTYKDNLDEKDVIIIFGKPDEVTYLKEGDDTLKILDYQFFKVVMKNGKSYRFEKVGEAR